MNSAVLGLAALSLAVAAIVVILRLQSRRSDGMELPSTTDRDLPGLSGSETAHPALSPTSQGTSSEPPEPAATTLAVLAIQVDGLAEVNERYGEVTGQRALREVLRAVRQTLRVADTCERTAPGRLIAVLPGLSGDLAGQVAMRLQRAVSSLALVTHSGDEVQLEVSVGKAIAPAGVTSVASLRQEAEEDLARRSAHPGATPDEADTGERLRRALPPSLN